MATLTLPQKKSGAEKDAAKKSAAQIVREERVTKATEWLIQTYPAFSKLLPLAIGVKKQTHADRPKSISGNILSIARDRWCASPRYLARLATADSMRHNLDGSVAGVVSPEHRQNAVDALAKL